MPRTRALVVAAVVTAIACPLAMAEGGTERGTAVAALGPAPMAPGDGFEVDLAGPTALDVGQPGRYTVNVTNHDVPATNLVLFVSTDGGFSSAQFAIVDDGDWTCEGTAFVQCLLPALASDTAAPTITLDMTPSEGATDPMTLFANLDVGQDSFGDDVTVDISAAVDLEIVGTRPTVVNGQPYTVPFVVSEVGSSDAPAAGPIEVLIDPFFFNGVSVTDGGVTVAGSGWSCAAFDCTHPGPVPAGGSLPALVASGTFTVEGSIQGSLLNGDDLFANNDVGVPIRPIDPDMVVIQGSPFQPKRGQAITYVAGAQNGGDSPITSAFTLSLTSSLDAPTATGTGWTCTAFSGGAATCTYPSTTLGQFQSLPLVTVGGTVPANATTLTGSATISPTGFRTNNDTRSFNVAVIIPPSDLAIDLTTTVTKVSPGGPFEATATVSNVGAGVATGTVTMSFSGPLTSLTASGSGWTCTATNCTHPGPVPAGGSLPVITLTGTVLSNLVSGAMSVFVSPGGPGGNDSDFVSLPLVRPDMTASLGSTTPTFDEGGQGTFTATITNVGPGDAYATVTASLSSPFQDTTASGTGWTCTNQTGFWSCTRPGPVAAGEVLPAISLSGTARDDFNGQADASVSVSLSTFADSNFANNSASLGVPINPLIDFGVTAEVQGLLAVGAPGTVVATVKNVGIGTVIDDLSVNYFGSGLSDVQPIGTDWACDFSRCFYLDDVGPGETLPPLTFTGTVSPTTDGTFEFGISVFHPDDLRSANDVADAEGLVTAPIDLTTSITDDGGPLVAGDDHTYVVTVSNVGTAPSDGTISLSLDRGFDVEVVDAAGNGWECSNSFCSTDAVVDGGGNLPTITFTVVPLRSFDGQVTTSVRVFGGGDGRFDNSDSDVSTPFPPAVDAVIAIEADTDVFLIGKPNSYTATVSNTGSSALEGPIVVDAWLDFDFADVAGVGGGWTCTSDFDPNIRCEHAGPIPPGASLPAIALSGDLADNEFSSTAQSFVSVVADADQRTDNNDESVNTPVAGESDLTVDVSDGTAAFGQPFTFTATVQNVLDTPAVGEVSVRLGGLGVLAATGSGTGWTCQPGDFDAVVCTHPGPVAASSSLPPITVAATAGATFDAIISPYAQVDVATDAIASNDAGFGTFPVTIGVDLDLEVDDVNTPFFVGEAGDVTVSVSNVGAQATTMPIVVSGLVGFADTTVTTDGEGWDCTFADGSLDCTHQGPVASGGSLPTLTLHVTPDQSGSLPTQLVVESLEDGRTGNNHASISTPVVAFVDLVVDVDDGGAAFVAGGTGSYSVTVRNDGSFASAGEVQVALTTSGASTVTTASGTGWTCEVGDTVTTCTTTSSIGALAALPPIDVVVQTTTGGISVALNAAVSGGSDDRTSNNFDSESTPIATPDLVVDVSDADATFTAPGTGTYTVLVRNLGSAPTSGAVDVSFSAGMPIQVTAVSGDGWVCDDTAPFSCSRSDALPAGQAFPPITVSVDVFATDARTASLTATASGLDTNAANSTDTDTTTVVVPADLTPSLTPGPWVVGRVSTADVVVTNVGSGPATGPVTVILNRGDDAGGDGWTCVGAGGGHSCEHAGPVAAGGSLPPITVTDTPALADHPTTTLSASVDDPSDGNSANDTSETTIDVVIAVDFTVDAAATPPFTVGQAGSATFTATNLGAETANGTVTVVIQQSSNGFPAVSGPGWSCLDLFGVTTCTHPGPVGSGAALAPITSSFQVTIGDYPNTSLVATVHHADDVRASNDFDSLSVPTKGVDLEVDLVDVLDGTVAEIGDTRVFEVTVENVGGLAPPGAATLTVDPGPGLIRGDFTGTGWACQPDGTSFTCSSTVPVPADGALPTLTFDAYVGGDAYPDTDLRVTVVAPGESRVNAFNDDRVAFEVTGAPDLRGELTAPDIVSVGDALDVGVVVRNTGVVDTVGLITVDLDLPAGSTDATGSGDGWTCAPLDDDPILRCQTPAVAPALGDLPPIAMSFVVGIGSYPQFNLHAAIDNASDEDPLNNDAQTSVRVIGIPDLRATLGLDVIAGRETAGTITIENTGTEPADGITTVTPDLVNTELGIRPTAASGDGWDCTPVVAADFTCTHAGPVPAEGALPPLEVTVLTDADRYDVGTPCAPQEFGDRLLRSCTIKGRSGFQTVWFDVTNPANVLRTELVAADSYGVQHWIDLAPSTSVGNLHPGSLATLTTTVHNGGVAPAPGPVVLVQRVECGLMPDLAPGDQGACLAGTDSIDVTVAAVRAEGWSCETADGVVTCTHPGPVPAHQSLPPVEVDAEIGSGLYRANLWLAPTVQSPADENLDNDQPERGQAVALRALPDLAVTTSTNEYTVGVNNLLGASIVNVGADPLTAPTLTVDHGPSFDVLDVQGDEWDCTQEGNVATCTYGGTIAAGATAGLSLVVEPLSTGATQQAVTYTVAHADDTQARNNTATAVYKIFEHPAPTAVLGIDRTVIRVNQTATFDASFSENTFPDTQFRWDFGDGVTEFGEVVTHAYQRPGTYTAVLRVSNGLRTSKATSRVIVIPDEPLVADAGDDRVAEEQLPIAFDGGASLPYFAIESYQWDFGDGESGVEGRNPQHIYTTPGIYTVTLTVRSGDEEATDTLTVDVREQGAGGGSGGLEVTVLDEQGVPIRAADVAVLDADGTRHSARTGDNGVASLKNLPDGRYSVYAYKLGFRPTIGRARVLGGLGTAAVTLARGAVGQASLEQRRLTLDEIIAAGIDINDPANLNVLEFEIQLGFRVDPNEPDILGGVGFMLNGEGEFVDIPIDWICNDELDRCEYSDPDVDVSVEVEEVEGQPVVTVLIIPVKASWLKEFFEVTMIVANLAPKGFAFTDGAATIDLPAGLTLAPTTDPQSLMVDLADIPAGKTGTARWIVRGDRAGEYDLGAAYTGVLEPLGVPVLLTARTNDPLKVWGTDAVNVRVRAQQQVRKGKPYLVRLGIENVSDGPIYNVAAELGDLGGDADFEYAPWTSRRLTADQVDPQTTTWFDIWLIPGFNGSLVSCNLCARGPAGRSALLAIDEGVYDTADLAGAFSGLAAGTSKDTDPSAVEIEPRADEGLTFTATSDGGVDHLAWAPVAGATGYEVWAVGGDAPLATLTGDVTEWTLPSGASAYVLATVFGDEVKDSRHPIAVPGAPVTPPVVTPDDTVAIAGESTVIDVLGNDADPSGGPLTITNVVQPEHGTVTCDDEGKCTYTPDDGFEGTDSFEVTVAGSNGVEVTHVVTVTVAAAGSNRNPVAVADALTVEAEIAGVVDVLANDSDPDDDSLTLESFTQPAHGVVDCTTDGECTYTSDLGFDGFDAFTYEVSDGDLSAQAAVAVTVTPGAGGTTTTSTTTTSTTSTTTTSTTSTTTTTTVPDTTSSTTTTTTVPDTTSSTTTTTTVPDTTSSTTTTTTTTVPPSSSSTTTTTAPSSGGSTTTTTAPQGGGGPPAQLPALPASPPPFTTGIPGAPSVVARGQSFNIPLPFGTQLFRVALYSDPVVLASGGAQPSVDVTVPVSTPTGTHTLVVWASVGGEVQVSGARIDVTRTVSGTGLPRTGGSPWTMVRVASVLLLLGAGIALAERRQRRAEEVGR